MGKTTPHHSDDVGYTAKRAEIISAITGACMVLLVLGHVLLLQVPGWRSQLVVATFMWFAFTVTAAHFGGNTTPKRPRPHQDLGVAVVVAIRDADPMAFRAMLDSLDRQTVLPRAVYVIENGRPGRQTEAAFRAWAATTKIERYEFVRRDRSNKREAHAVAAVREIEATITLTLDGYTVLEPSAIKEGLEPFCDEDVMSVGGLLVGRNREKSLLTRVLDIGFVSSLVVERAAWSALGSVAANRGGLAFYRTWIIKRHLHEYLTQTVFGQSVTSGDDRMLTGFAAYEGKTVFCVKCVGTTLLPETMQHATDRQTRWWRTHWIGVIWVIRRFSPKRAIWWLTVFQTASFILHAATILLLLAVDPVMTGRPPWMFVVYLVALGYVRTASTLAVRRPGQSVRSQIAGFVLLSPLAALVDMWFNVVLLLRGMVTPHQTEWQPHKVRVSA